MSLYNDSPAKKIQNILNEVHKLVCEIESARRQFEFTWEKIQKTKNRIQKEEMQDSIEQRKLKLNKAVDNAKKKEDLLRNTLEKINEIRSIKYIQRKKAQRVENKEPIRRGALMKMLLEVAHTLPLYIGKTPNAIPPPLCGCIPPEPSYIAKSGNIVAAFVKSSDNEENWILAEIVNFNYLLNEYEIDDIDEEVKERHTVCRRHVMPLPIMRANPETDPHAIFSKNTIVMALYPQTTCFYKAIIITQPTTAHEDYEVIFEDTTYINGYSSSLRVPQRYIISIKDSKKRIKINRN